MEKTITLGKVEDNRKRRRQNMRYIGAIKEATALGSEDLNMSVNDWTVWR